MFRLYEESCFDIIMALWTKKTNLHFSAELMKKYIHTILKGEKYLLFDCELVCYWCLGSFNNYVDRRRCVVRQVQAIGMYGAAQPDFFKSETNGGIKNIISYHLKIIKRCVFSPNLEVVAQKISLPRPWEVSNGQGRGSTIFQAIPIKICEKLTSHEIFNW